MMVGWARRWVWRAVLLGGLAWVAGLIAFAERVSHFGDPAPGETDAIVALTGGDQRLRAGLELLRQGAAPRLFISGVYRGLDVAHLMAELREDPQGFECCIDLGYAATNTKGNAIETAQWARGHQIGSLRLVTSNYHMPRSLLELRRTLPDVEIVPHPVATDSGPPEPWYGSLFSVRRMAIEYCKYLFVWVGG